MFQVKLDMLQLRVPVWVSDMDFLRDSAKVAVCTRYGHVSLHAHVAQAPHIFVIVAKDCSLLQCSSCSLILIFIFTNPFGKVTVVFCVQCGVI